MADFSKAFKKTASFEGGYVNNPNDRGGETYKGISRKCFPDWTGWKTVDSYKRSGVQVKDLEAKLKQDSALNALVEDFYKKEFWDGTNSDRIQSQEVAEFLFDASVNHGKQSTAEWLQRSLNCLNKKGSLYPNLIVDGDVGNATIGTIKLIIERKEVPYLIKCLNVLRGAFYISITVRTESQEEFIRGWLNRVSIS